MTRNLPSWRSLYVGASVLTSGGAALGAGKLHAATKYAIAPLLMADVATRPGAFDAERRPTTVTLLTALAGSALGDHFMLAESRTSGLAARAHLRRGASCFAVQQLGLMSVLARAGYRWRPRPTRAAGVALAALAVVDGVAARRDAGPSTPDPIVAAYGVSLAAMAALTQGAPTGRRASRRIAVGGPLFLASDAVIVARQLLPTGALRNLSDGVVMATYTAALALLVEAAADLERDQQDERAVR